MRRDGMITNPMSPEQFQQFIDNEKKVWTPVVEQVGLAVGKRNSAAFRRTRQPRQ